MRSRPSGRTSPTTVRCSTWLRSRCVALVAVAAAGVDAVALAVVPVPEVAVVAPAAPSVGLAVVLRIATAGWPWRPWITNSAGWRLLAPPTGIIEIARWRPGARCTWLGGAPRQAVGAARAHHRAGDETRLTKPLSVPESVARTGRY